jgi:YesN/AraC family two-component response regulator
MRLLNRGIKSLLLKKYIVINFLVIFLPISIVAVLYCSSVRNEFLSQYIGTEKYTLAQEMNSVNYIMKSFSKIAQQIALDDEMTPYQLRKGNYSTVRALKKLELYRANAGYFEEIAIYLYGDDKVYTSCGTTKLDVFTAKSYQFTENFGADGFEKLINSKKIYDCTLFGEYIKPMVGNTKYSIVTYPLGKNYNSQYGTIFGIYKAEVYDKLMINNDNDMENITMMMDGNSNLLYSSIEEGIEDILFPLKEVVNDYENSNKVQKVKLNGKIYIVQGMRSDLTGWHYINMFQKSTIGKIQLKMQLPMLILLIASLIVLTVIFSVLLAIYNYLPIQNLYKLFDKKVRYDEKRNELLYLHDYIRGLMDQNSNINEELMVARNEKRMDIVKKLLRGKVNLQSDSMQEMFETLDIRFESRYFYTLVIRILKKNLEGDRELLLHHLKDLEDSHIYLTEMIYKDYFAVLYNTDGAEEDILELSQKILDYVKIIGMEVKIGIGNQYESEESLKFSLMEGIIAVESVEDEIITQFSDLIVKKTGARYWYPMEEELKLKQVLLQSGKEELEEVLDNLKRELLIQKKLRSNTEMQYILFRIISSLLDLPRAYIVNVDEVANQLIYYTDIDDFFYRLEMFCEDRINTSTKNMENKKQLRINDIIEFIDTHYQESYMSLGYVAEQFDMTGSYLSKVFKEHAGMNFINYISDKRLYKANELLVTTNISIEKIMEIVGYSDLASFTRKYTKRYYMTPGLYRKTYRKDSI